MRNSKIKKPWPTRDAMKQIYELKLWGTGNSRFFSGEGSHREDLIQPYIEAVVSFLRSFDSPLVVCDLGCGDFNVGKMLVNHAKKYIAVDIVAELISYNRENFKNPKLEFLCLDIAKEHLPSADCVILKQVLQHLSNAEIYAISEKLSAYKYVILTEHLPKGDFQPNKDIISGQGIRIKKKSGVNLLASPFNLHIKEQQVLLTIDLGDDDGILVTTLSRHF